MTFDRYSLGVAKATPGAAPGGKAAGIGFSY
jgi:hypothetical protein